MFDRIIAYDWWCSDRIEAALTWLDEWLSIPQKRVEQSMIVIFCIASFIGPLIGLLKQFDGHAAIMLLIYELTGFRLVGTVFIAQLMWWMHRRPAAMRGIWKRRPSMGRVFFQLFFFFICFCFWLTLPHLVAVEESVVQVVMLLFYYVADIGSTGQRGRKRKLALAKLKELFGGWLPNPLPVPNG
jgi:hypothetical protein